MKITDKDVLHVADLANLELTAQERERMVRDLNSILEYIDRLNELKTADVPPMAQTFLEGKLSANAVKASATFREDEPRPSLQREAAVANAPDSDGAFFKVPKVIDR